MREERISHKEMELIQYLNKVSVPYIIAVNKIEFGDKSEFCSEIKMLKQLTSKFHALKM